MTTDRDRQDALIRRRYANRSLDDVKNPGNAFIVSQLRSMLTHGFHQRFADRPIDRILDIGCGELYWCSQFEALGVDSSRCFGVDLLDWRLRKGRDEGRGYSCAVASAANLPFHDNLFTLVSQFVVMTSITNSEQRKKTAAEMIRVTAPGGYIFWYDFRYNNPANTDTRAIGRREIKSLFPGLPVTIQSLTPLPPLVRKIPRFLSGILPLLHGIPMLRTHYMAWIGPKR